jgi:SpoVK/Ycf46/Vps4 family AAA+-type ATPase
MLGFGTEKSEKFVLRKSTHYLICHLRRFRTYDKGVLRMLCWILGREISTLKTFLIHRITDQTTQAYLMENLSDTGFDPEDSSDVIFQVLKKVNPTAMRKFHAVVCGLLMQRDAALRYSGKSNLEKSFAAIRKMFDLTEQEIEFCIFLFISSSYDEPDSFFNDHLRTDKFQGRKYAVNILQISWKALDRTLRTLKNIGLIDVDSHNFEFNQDFLCLLQNPAASDFSQHLYRRLTPVTVPLDYHFISEDTLQHLLKLLRVRPQSASNLLFYGPPGTGKTALAQGLVKEAGVRAYEIARDENNNSFNRRAALVACLNMTAVGSGAVIIVDEADNLLNTKFSWLTRGETQDKGWLNKILEEPGTRIIWITNHIDEIETSVLRRFAFSLQFKPFNRRQRIRLWERVLRQNKAKRFFKKSDIEHLAKSFKTSAGAIDLAVKKAIEIEAGSKKRLLKSIRLSLSAHQTLQSRGRPITNKDSLEDRYTLDGLNLNGDLKALQQQLKRYDRHLRHADNSRRINFNLLLYGPPGAGKSEFARYVATVIDRELICKSYSDIQSPFVGMGERNLRDAFEEAEAESAILVIDEIDSFLFPRDRSGRSWETSFTNEFLTCMERFAGFLIGTTNRLVDLDAAAIRRFNHKVGFDYLTPEGNLVFYRKLLGGMVAKGLNRKDRSELKRISPLAPGDFKIVRDRFAFYEVHELAHSRLIAALATEARIKAVHSGARTIGFS